VEEILIEQYLINQRLKELSYCAFNPENLCFDKQLAFIRDTATFKTAVCSRRAGKTIACAMDLLNTAQAHENVVCLYITLKRTNAKRIIWPELLRLNQDLGLGGHANETDLSLKFVNGSVIYCSGAKDKSEIENFRGLALKLVYIDEAQAFRSYLQDLIDDVLSKALFDYNGTLCLIGTPGLVPAGYFYECATSPKWSHHHWTMFDNPWLEKKSGKSVMELVVSDCERMGVDIDHPKIQRENYGRWVVDPSARVFQYVESKNHYDELPEHQDWEYVIGVDIGYHDSDAISVIGWNPKVKNCYLVYESVKNKQGITELAQELITLSKTYDPLKIVMDTGGLGKKIAEEINKRHDVTIEAAEKTRKFEFIELLNDALRTQKFSAKKTSKFAEDSVLVEWDRDTKLDKPKISESYHSDICDSVLYAYREALHWLYEPEIKKPKSGTPEYRELEEREMEEEAFKRAFQKDELEYFHEMT
jgi:hypothetical protein